MKDDTTDDGASGAYSLDALTPSEREEFERRLLASEDLRAEVAGFTDTAALLGGAVRPVEPPARLKNSILGMLDATPQLPPLHPAGDFVPAADQPSTSTAPVDAAPRPAVESATPVAPVASLDEARRARSPRRRFSIGLVAAAAAVALFAGGVAIGGTVFDGSSDTASSELAAISAAEDVQRIDVELPGGGSAALLASAELGRSAVVMHDVELPDDQVYQAWFVRADGPVSAGVLPDSDDDYAILEGAYSEGDVVALTREPAGGSEQPTTDPVLFSAASGA